jgi:DNA-directed RNA polymerase specialized sigma24 family protein
MQERERFPKTSWTLLNRARERTDDGARAREEFAQRYYNPVQEFLQVLVKNREQAEELTQEFFTKLSGPAGLWEHARPKEGKFFRDYLLTALRNFATDYYRRNRSEAFKVHPDQATATGWDFVIPPSYQQAEAKFHRGWVKITLAAAHSEVRAACARRMLDVHLNLFEARYLGDSDIAPRWDKLGALYGLDQKTARERADTVAEHFRRVLRRMLRNQITVPPGASREMNRAIDEEIRALLAPIED